MQCFIVFKALSCRPTEHSAEIRQGGYYYPSFPCEETEIKTVDSSSELGLQLGASDLERGVSTFHESYYMEIFHPNQMQFPNAS